METIHESVRDRYRSAAQGAECCGSTAGACCSAPSGDQIATGMPASTAFGYSIEELRMLPDGADLSLGCGNPTALAGLTEGEVVVDLGSGGGIDCLLAAARVGDTGRVIGVDMTAEMISLARANAEKAGATNVEFRLGEIEHLPLADREANVIISNCVINLSPDKSQVLAEAHRVLAPGGRFMVSDLVVEGELREDLRSNMTLLTGCIAGAMQREAFLGAIRAAGFSDVRVEKESPYLKHDHLASLAAEAGISAEDATEIAASVRSVSVFASKP